MEKIYHSRTNISNDVLLLMAKVSALTKQLNGLTLAEQPQKQEIIKELFGSVGDNHCSRLCGNKECAAPFSGGWQSCDI